MHSAFGVEHEPISKAGPAAVAGFGGKKAVTTPVQPKIPGVPTPDPTKTGALKYLAKEKIKKNPFATTGAVAGGSAAAGYAGSQYSASRNRY